MAPQTYQANCHCGAVKYTVKLDEALAPEGEGKVMQCNCSICTKNGYLLVYPKREDVVFLQGEDKLKEHFFGLKLKPHRFCGDCGSSILIDFKNADNEKVRHLIAINARMFKDFDVSNLSFTYGDGKTRLAPVYEV